MASFASDDSVIRMVLATVFGILGNLTSLAVFLAPWRIFRTIRSNGAVGEYSPFPYLAALFNCAVWVFYALPMVHPNSTPVLIISGIGVVIDVAYVGFFLYYSAAEMQRNVFLWLVAELMSIGFVATLVLTLAHSQENRSKAFGMLGAASSIGMYFSPLLILISVCQTGSVEYMDLDSSWALLANSIVWTIYAFILQDLYMLIANVVGVVCSVVQLAVYAKFNNSNYDALA